MKDKKRTKELMRLYKREEIESMNYILGKPSDNNYFTKWELKLMSNIDLFNRKVVEVCKKIWENEMIGGEDNGNTSIINSVKAVAESQQV